MAKGLSLLRLRFAIYTLLNQWNMQSRHILQVHLLLVILNCQHVQCLQKDERPTCSECGTVKNLCVCLICGFVGCGRYEKRHAIKHWTDAAHHYSLELETQQIWDYIGDKYVQRWNQSKGDSKLVTVNSRCTAADGECTT